MPTNLPDGAACLIDANIFYYHFVETEPFSDHCSDLLERVAQGALVGFTSVHLLAEATHKIMLAEAAARFEVPRASLVNWLQAHRKLIAELTEFPDMVVEMCSLPMTCLPVAPPTLTAAAHVAREHRLLTNDALTIALMHEHGLTDLVTNDDDFDAVPGISVWKPR